MLDNQVGSSLIVHRSSKGRLELFRYIEVVEDGNIARVLSDDVLLVRCNESNIIFNLLVYVIVVDVDTVVSGVEEVAQQCYGSSCFLKD